jgi:hypothetical protein
VTNRAALGQLSRSIFGDKPSSVQGRTPKVTCTFSPGSSPGKLTLEPPPPPPSRNTEYCLGAIVAAAAARYLSWQQPHGRRDAALRILRTLVWAAHLAWCGSFVALRVLPVRSSRSDTTAGFSAGSDPEPLESPPQSPRPVPSLQLDHQVRRRPCSTGLRTASSPCTPTFAAR